MLRLLVRLLTRLFVDMAERYLLAQGSLTWHETLEYEVPDFVLFANALDRLGWDCFVKVQIASFWLQAIKPIFTDSHLFLTMECWARQFITKLLASLTSSGSSATPRSTSNAWKASQRQNTKRNLPKKLKCYSWWDPMDISSQSTGTSLRSTLRPSPRALLLRGNFGLS